MTDKELLEYAAKAAGINRYYYEYLGEWGMIEDDPESGWWNPLIDDGEALRLAVKLRIDIADAQVTYWDKHSTDPYAATRRSIVRAAAEIGRSMK